MCRTVQYSLFTFHIITWMIALHWWLLFRLEFDAYRSDLEELSLGPRDAVAMARIDDAQQEYQVQKDKYERLRSDVIIKLKFLEENKVTSLIWPAAGTVSLVMKLHKTLLTFLSAPISGKGDAQAAPALPQRHLRLLCRQPAAAGANTEAVQHKAEAPGGRQALLVRGAMRGPPLLDLLLQPPPRPPPLHLFPVETPTYRGPEQREDTCRQMGGWRRMRRLWGWMIGQMSGRWITGCWWRTCWCSRKHDASWMNSLSWGFLLPPLLIVFFFSHSNFVLVLRSLPSFSPFSHLLLRLTLH